MSYMSLIECKQCGKKVTAKYLSQRFCNDCSLNRFSKKFNKVLSHPKYNEKKYSLRQLHNLYNKDTVNLLNFILNESKKNSFTYFNGHPINPSINISFLEFLINNQINNL